MTSSGAAGAVQATGGAASDSTGHTYHAGYFCGGSVTIGGVTATGTYAPDSSYCDIYVVKMDSDGVVVWIKTFGAYGMYDFPDNIAVDASGNVYLTGYFQDSPAVDFGNGVVLTDQTSGVRNRFVVKLNSSGLAQWGKVLGGTTTGAIGYAQVAVGSSVFVYAPFGGSSNTSFVSFGSLTVSNNTPSTFLLRLDPTTGNYLSVDEIGGAGTTRANALTVDESGNAYVGGDFNGTALTIGGTNLVNGGAGAYDAFIAKFSPTGAPVWAKRFGGGGNDAVWHFDVASGVVALSGAFTSSSVAFGSTNLIASRPLNAGEVNLFLGKIGQDGSFLGAKVLGSGTFWPAGVRMNDAESIYVAGAFAGTVRIGSDDFTSRGGDDVFVLKATTDSGVKWARTMGGAVDDYYGSIVLDGSRSPVVAFDSYFNGSGNPSQPVSTPIQIGAVNYNVTSPSTFFLRVGPEGALN
ncbi:MAG: SBBP repeat-containing protein [Ilumatobacteraceae bacterium]